jgi:hypothetical protein
MTSIGRFSLKSESAENLSIPTFFMALSGEKKEPSPSSALMSNTRNIFTVSDFESLWMERGMPSRHPRFHSTVSQHDDRYFEETHHVHPGEEDEDEPSLRIKAELDRHVSETMHFTVYRDDLRNRIEHMLTSPIEVSDKLWEVKISSGTLGSSGAISQVKTDMILEKMKANAASLKQSPIEEPSKQHAPVVRRRATLGRIWNDVAREAQQSPKESVLLFRSHHALADGASTIAALSDLCDEAEEIRANIEMELKRWKRGGKSKKSAIRRILARLIRYLKLCLWFTFGSVGAFAYQGYLQLTTLRNPFDAVKEYATKQGVLECGRSISWCDAAPLEEAKMITQIIGKAKGVNITVNDLFVSCVTAAIVRQLIEHEEFMAPMAPHNRKLIPNHVNVVVPVHLRGGVVLPEESVGNKIGAFVSRCPGEMRHDAVGGGTSACPTERLVRVSKSLSLSKKSPAALLSHYTAKFCSDYLPETWTQSLFKRANANACVAVSNNRGYHKKLHLNGMAVQSVGGFLPLPPGIPVGVVVQSYAGTMSLSLTAEKWAVPDADKFLRWVLDEYQRLREEVVQLEKIKRHVE